MLSAIVLLAGCAAGTLLGAGQGGRSDDGRSYAEARNDNLLAAKVNRAMVRAKELRAQDIQVSVLNAVVTLTGTVPNEGSIVQAGRVAQSVNGVKTVINNLRGAP